MNNKIIDIFKNYVLDWINRNYQQIKEVRQADSRLAAAEKGLALIAHFDHNAPTIRKEKAFHTIMLQLKIFSPVLLTRVDYLRQEMRSQSAFLFLMHIFE